MQKLNYLLQHTSKLVALVFLISIAGCKEADQDVKPKTVTDVFFENEDFSILYAAIKYAGLSDALRTSTLTVFAPNDSAFHASGYPDAAAIQALPAAAVRQILEYHIMASAIKSEDLGTGTNQELPTLANNKAFITKTGSGTSINGAKVIDMDIKAANGIIHVIDRLIVPANRSLMNILQGNDEYSFLVAAITRAATSNPDILTKLTSDASSYTVFVPTNQAFIDAGFPSAAALQAAGPTALTSLIMYHVVPGRLFSTNLATGSLTTASNKQIRVETTNGLKVSGPGNMEQPANVTRADILAQNGVIHVIDRLLLP
ncbi:fasciclin domain-containing protein [Telluribacter humicola]|uniref:fasciclin domain-containing protein n=1 Tax=Telluribacter humicola TaxID=1720261 RepID=UPI001A95BA5F|nr:fasciclin domain-containing protein [Telluribacter humicola]